MEEFILSETNKLFNKAIKKFAKEDKKDEKDVSIILGLDANEEVKYTLCHDHKPHRETSIKEILNVKAIDMKGYTVLVPPQIKKIIESLRSNLNSKNVEVSVYQSRKEDEDDEMQYFCYVDGNYLKEVNLIDLIK
jgi:hypothetical protein